MLVSHGGDPLRAPGKPVQVVGSLLIVDGRTGKSLFNVSVPDYGETYYSPQVYEKEPGVFIVLLGTGGETHGGVLWAAELRDLFSNDTRATKIVPLISS